MPRRSAGAPALRTIGTSVPKLEGFDKVTGRARYLDDLRIPGVLHGRTVRSTIPRGEIAKIRLGSDREGLTVADWLTSEEAVAAKKALLEHLRGERSARYVM